MHLKDMKYIQTGQTHYPNDRSGLGCLVFCLVYQIAVVYLDTEVTRPFKIFIRNSVVSSSFSFQR